MPDTSDSSAGAAIGCVICHAPPSFFSVVASPAADFTLISSILSASQRREDLLLLLRVASAPPSGIFQVTK